LTATALLESLRSLGVRLSASGDRLRFRAPVGVLTPELRAALVEEKPALLAALRDMESQASEVSRRLSPDGPGWVAVRSHVLGETVLFIRDEAVPVPPDAGDLVNYTRAELEILSTATEPGLKDIHRAKKLLGGRVTALNAVREVPVAKRAV
jgi:hypothetical protein